MTSNKIVRFVIIITLATINPSSLLARTIGNYVGLDMVRTGLSFSTEKHYDDKTIKSLHTYETSSVSFGLNYGYAINYKGFFIAPHLIFENNNDKNLLNKTSQYGEVNKNYYGRAYSKISKRYGAKLDIGADISNNFSLYGVVGYANNNYENYTSIYYYKDYAENKFSENPWVITRGNKSAPFFGAGFKIKLFQRWAFNTEYTQTKFKTPTNAKTQDNPQNVLPIDKGPWHNKLSLNNDIRIIKFGLSYNF